MKRADGTNGEPSEDGRVKRLVSRASLLRRASLLLLLIVAGTILMLRADVHTQHDALRIFAIMVLAFLPGWLFLRFVTVRACSVWDEYVLNLHRLEIDRPEYLPEPPCTSAYYERWVAAGGLKHVKERNLYRDKFEAHYGKGTTRARRGIDPKGWTEGAMLKAETYFPVFLSTAVFAVGWTAVLGAQAKLLSLPMGHPASWELSTPDLLRLGFVGAYLFTLQMLVRRYFQADLKASAYVNAVTRVVSAVILVLVAHLALPQSGPEASAAVAFIIGFFPLVGLQAIQKAAAVVLRTVVPTLRNAYPLSDLDGLSVWYEARLLELGVEDMQNLATANLVDVTLHSRVPVSRLVDWVDQAHLYLHLEPSTGSGRGKDANVSRDTLRRLGIRTASALEQAMTPCPEGAPTLTHGLVSAADNAELLAGLRTVLNADGKGPSVTTSIVKTLRNDPNMIPVRAWRRDWTADGDRAPSQTEPVPATEPAPGSAPLNGNGNGLLTGHP